MDAIQAADAQDSLRPIRQFVGLLSGAFAAYDQTYAGTDGQVGSYPRTYQTLGPYGMSVEGTVISTTNTGAVVISPMVVLLGIGFAAAMLLTKTRR